VKWNAAVVLAVTASYAAVVQAQPGLRTIPIRRELPYSRRSKKLEVTKAPVDVLAIDRAERPSQS
jgi:hypothetical protein